MSGRFRCRRFRSAVLAGASIVSVAAPAVAPGGASACWPPPVAAPIVAPFVEPSCTWCAGHRGVEFGPTGGRAVRAVAAGVVAFAGVVVGARYVSVDLPDGRRVTYGLLQSIAVATGAHVAAGALVGYAGPRLMLTVRVDGRYTDPEPLLGRAVRRPWLVPAGGSPGRPPPPARLVCPVR